MLAKSFVSKSRLNDLGSDSGEILIYSMAGAGDCLVSLGFQCYALTFHICLTLALFWIVIAPYWSSLFLSRGYPHIFLLDA